MTLYERAERDYLNYRAALRLYFTLKWCVLAQEAYQRMETLAFAERDKGGA